MILLILEPQPVQPCDRMHVFKTEPQRVSVLDRTQQCFDPSQEDSGGVSLNLTLNGRNYTYNSPNIETELSSDPDLAYLLQNESFIQETTLFRHMFWNFGGYTRDECIIVDNSSGLIHKINPFVFFNQTIFVELIVHSVGDALNETEPNYRLHDLSTITISESNTSGVSTHIDILESVLDEAPTHGVSIYFPGQRVPGQPLLLGRIYTYGNLTWYLGGHVGPAGESADRMTYMSPLFNDSLLQELHWGVFTYNKTIVDDIFGTSIGMNNCMIHFTLDGHLFAIAASPPIPIDSRTWQPWVVVVVGVGSFALLAVAIIYIRKWRRP